MWKLDLKGKNRKEDQGKERTRRKENRWEKIFKACVSLRYMRTTAANECEHLLKFLVIFPSIS